MKLRLALLALGLLFAGTAAAQSTSTADTSSNANASTSSGAQSVNAGVTAQVNQMSSGDVHYQGGFDQTVKAQVPVSVVGYGSFSQMSCQTSVGVGATSRVFSFVYNGPKADINCEHGGRSTQFGQESQLAAQQKQYAAAEILRSAGVWETCTSNPATQDMCLEMGLVKPTDKTKKVDGQTVAVVIPAPALPVGIMETPRAVAMEKPSGAIDFTKVQPIPSRPEGWTNEQLIKDQQTAAAGQVH